MLIPSLSSQTQLLEPIQGNNERQNLCNVYIYINLNAMYDTGKEQTDFHSNYNGSLLCPL